MSEKINVYKAIVKTPYGDMLFAVLSTEYDARADIFTAVQHDSKMPFGMIRVGEVAKSNRRILKSMIPVRDTTCEGGHWAYVKKI